MQMNSEELKLGEKYLLCVFTVFLPLLLRLVDNI